MNPVVQDIVNQLKPLQAEKIILFGSYAYGKPTQDSDVDLLVIKKPTHLFLKGKKRPGCC